MNTRLLSIIKSEQERRNAPAVLAMKEKTGRESPYEKTGFGKLWIVLRGIRTSFHLASYYDSIEQNLIIFPRNGHKYDEVEQELTAAGLKTGHISKTDGAPSLANRLIAFISVVKCLVEGYSYYRKPNAFKFFEVLFLYTVLNKWLINSKKDSAWIIIGDLSPSLISLAAACKYTGQITVYWQYSLLDFKHISADADAAIVLNETGIHLSKIHPDKQHYWRRIGEIETVNTENIQKGPVGILLNVHAHDKAWNTIFDIQKAIGLPCIVRFHPNSKLAVPDLPQEISVSDKAESLENFAERISLAVCGNTQAQAKLIMMGVPVVQLQGLDQLYFDFHGYIERDIVPGIKKPADFDINQIVSFYHSDKYKTGLSNLIGPTGENRKPGLDAFVNWLTSSSS